MSCTSIRTEKNPNQKKLPVLLSERIMIQITAAQITAQIILPDPKSPALTKIITIAGNIIIKKAVVAPGKARTVENQESKKDLPSLTLRKAKQR